MHPFRNKAIFCDEEFLAPRPTPKLEEKPLSVVRICLFNLLNAKLNTSCKSQVAEFFWVGI